MKSMWIAGVSAVLLTTLPIAAQPVIGAKSGIVNYVEGRVSLADKPLELQPTQFPEIKENVVLQSEEGRAEVLLTPGTVLRVGENTSIKMITNRLVDTRLELLTGSVTLVAMEVAKEASVTIVYKDATVTFPKAGIYRLDADPGLLKVFKGGAEVKTGTAVTAVAAGKMLTLTGALATAEKFNPELTDSLDRWTRRRDELMAASNVSAANQARRTGLGASSSGCGGRYGNNPAVIMNLGSWGYNPYYGLGTYIPCRGMVNSPYGYRYYSPLGAYQAFFAPRPVYQMPSGGGGMGSPSYQTAAPSSGGYSGVSSSSGSSAPSAPAAAPSSGSSSAASAASSAVGGGAAGAGGGRGH
jgi:hypothetical protein